MKSVSILIVDDSESARFNNQLSVKSLFKNFDSSELKICLAATANEMFQLLKKEKFHVILLDHDLGEDENGEQIEGISFIPSILEIQPRTRILVITSFKSTQLAVKAIEAGAKGFITKGCSDEELYYKDQQILKALKEAQFEIESLKGRFTSQYGIDDYICESTSMKNIDIQLQSLSTVNSHVLFLGESGLGKTHAAKRLNELSKAFYKQKERFFVNININELPDTLIESELFGHEKGAFTGATQRKKGLFELATNGDILLDEIGDASLKLQAKLLKVVEEKTFKRVGGNQVIKTNARIMFATNKDLEDMVAKNKFKNDLYARICAFSIQMPSLNDRKEDIPHICRRIATKFRKQSKIPVSYDDFPLPLKEYFQRDNIRFNIRGIKNDIERLMILCPLKNKVKLDYTDWKHVVKNISVKNTLGTIHIMPENSDSMEISSLINSLVSHMGSEKWPGIITLKDKLEAKAFLTAYEKYPTNIKRAQVLGLSTSVASSKLKRYLPTK